MLPPRRITHELVFLVSPEYRSFMLGAIVLCGGLSTRMGRPKALLPWRGTTMIEHVANILHTVVDEVIAVASAELTLPPLNARIVRDREPRLGPLGGIREGLDATSSDLLYVTATDAPYLTAEFVRTILSYGTAAAPEVDGIVQSLAAAYPRTAAPIAHQLITASRLRPLFLLEAMGYRKIEPAALPDIQSLQNLNTSEAYLEAIQRETPQGQAAIELFGTARARTGIATLNVSPGRLGDVLRSVPLPLQDHLISLNGSLFVRDPNVPIGPGDRVLILDAAAGG